MSHLPSLDRLAISGHAFERARERLGAEPSFFRHWVDATKAGWFALNADFFRAHGLTVSACKNLFHCPWTPGLHLCLPVSDDAALLTVMAYEPRQDQQAAAGAAFARLDTTVRQLQGELGAARRTVEDLRRSQAEVMPGCFLPGDPVARAAVRLVCHGGVDPAAVLAAAGVPARRRADGWLALVCRAYAEDRIGLPSLRALVREEQPRPLLLAAAKDDYAAARGRGASPTVVGFASPA